MPNDLLLVDTRDGVTTLTFNHPRRLNGWTAPMLEALLETLPRIGQDDVTKAIVITGSGRYYSAGVNLGGALKLPLPHRREHAGDGERQDEEGDPLGTAREFPHG